MENGIVRLGSKVIPPSSLYRRIFDNAHQTHNGVNATLKLVQNEFYWHGMRNTIESMVRNCDECCKHRFKPIDTTHKWPAESDVWRRVHIDFGYHRLVGNILVVVDAFSGWLEALPCVDQSFA